MENMSWVTSWEKWRQAMGPRGSAQRDAMNTFLQTHPAIMYWGDSWFSTPLYLNLARQSAGKINGLSILVGKPGAEAAELFDESSVRRYVSRIKNNPFDLLCLSAGGNDCLDERLATVFADWQGTGKAKIDANSAYQLMAKSTAFKDVRAAYDRLLTALKPIKKARPNFKVIGHPYVPIHKIGAKADLTVTNAGLIAWVKEDVGPWMWNRMQYVLHDEDQGKIFVDKILVDGFKKGVLESLAEGYPDFFVVADFSGLTGDDEDEFWNDEIHPTQAGFLKISKFLNDKIRHELPALKKAAVA